MSVEITNMNKRKIRKGKNEITWKKGTQETKVTGMHKTRCILRLVPAVLVCLLVISSKHNNDALLVPESAYFDTRTKYHHEKERHLAAIFPFDFLSSHFNKCLPV